MKHKQFPVHVVKAVFCNLISLHVDENPSNAGKATGENIAEQRFVEV